MDLTYTDEQQAFREEVRTWLAANVSAERLQSFDTEEGFLQHRDWEAKLNQGRWGMVTWPEELGGRGCDSDTGQNYRRIARQYHQASDQSPLMGDHREYEVVVPIG